MILAMGRAWSFESHALASGCWAESEFCRHSHCDLPAAGPRAHGVVMSWTGSEKLRKEQGTCRPPKQAPNKTPRFTIRPGTTVAIRKIEGSQGYIPSVTRVILTFEAYEHYDRARMLYTFRQDGYWLQIHPGKVIHRKRT